MSYFINNVSGLSNHPNAQKCVPSKPANQTRTKRKPKKTYYPNGKDCIRAKRRPPALISLITNLKISQKEDGR